MDYDIIFNDIDCGYILRHNNKIYRFKEFDTKKEDWDFYLNNREIYIIEDYKEIPILFIEKMKEYDGMPEHFKNYRSIDDNTLDNISAYLTEKLWRRFRYDFDLMIETVEKNKEVLTKWWKRMVKMCKQYNYDLDNEENIKQITKELMKGSCYFPTIVFLYMFYGEDEKEGITVKIFYKLLKKYD